MSLAGEDLAWIELGFERYQTGGKKDSKKKDVNPIFKKRSNQEKKEKEKRHTIVQTVLFSTSNWDASSAKAWLKEHGYKYSDQDSKEKHLRFRQYEPNELRKLGYKVFRTFRLGKGIEFILGILENKY
jgi:hypothetical protein